MTLAIEAKNLTLKYGRQTALNNLTFRLGENKIYGLLGRNGAGKTSLLSLIASFREPTSGTLTVGGQIPFENRAIMQQVIFVHDMVCKDGCEKVKEMLETVARYRPNYDRDYAADLVARFNLPLDKEVKYLSKGMQAALNVTMGLASRSPVTIFDEAYLGMDAPTREIFYQALLEDQSKHPRIIILSTHLVSEMDYLFDEILILHRGNLLLQEDYESLISRGASVTGDATAVDDFVRGKTVLSAKQLGRTKSVMIYGELTESERRLAHQKGLEIGPVSLQDLFIHLTEEEE